MTEIKNFCKVRDRNVITVPKPILEFLNVNVDDHVGFQIKNDQIIMHKVRPTPIPNGNGNGGSSQGNLAQNNNIGELKQNV